MRVIRRVCSSMAENPLANVIKVLPSPVRRYGSIIFVVEAGQVASRHIKSASQNPIAGMATAV